MRTNISGSEKKNVFSTKFRSFGRSKNSQAHLFKKKKTRKTIFILNNFQKIKKNSKRIND